MNKLYFSHSHEIGVSIYNKEKNLNGLHPFRKRSLLIRIYKVISFLHGLHHFELLTAMSLISAYFCAFNCTVVWFIFPLCMIFFKRINNNLNEGRDNWKWISFDPFQISFYMYTDNFSKRVCECYTSEITKSFFYLSIWGYI